MGSGHTPDQTGDMREAVKLLAGLDGEQAADDLERIERVLADHDSDDPSPCDDDPAGCTGLRRARAILAEHPVRTDGLDFPTAWRLQARGDLEHDERCSSVPGWSALSGPGLLCDCGAVERLWGERVAAAAVETTADALPAGLNPRALIARMICWPEFDATCIEGGCGYCDMGEWVGHATLELLLERLDEDAGGKLPVHRSGTVATLPRVALYRQAESYDFYNAPTRRAGDADARPVGLAAKDRVTFWQGARFEDGTVSSVRKGLVFVRYDWQREGANGQATPLDRLFRIGAPA